MKDGKTIGMIALLAVGAYALSKAKPAVAAPVVVAPYVAAPVDPSIMAPIPPDLILPGDTTAAATYLPPGRDISNDTYKMWCRTLIAQGIPCRLVYGPTAQEPRHVIVDAFAQFPGIVVTEQMKAEMIEETGYWWTPPAPAEVHGIEESGMPTAFVAAFQLGYLRQNNLEGAAYEK